MERLYEETIVCEKELDASEHCYWAKDWWAKTNEAGNRRGLFTMSRIKNDVNNLIENGWTAVVAAAWSRLVVRVENDLVAPVAAAWSRLVALAVFHQIGNSLIVLSVGVTWWMRMKRLKMEKRGQHKSREINWFYSYYVLVPVGFNNPLNTTK